jgi:hypothetical protein
VPGRGIRGIRDKKRWDEASARKALQAMRASGMSLAAFAAKTGIGAWRLRSWQRKLGPGPGEGVAVRFLPVRVRGSAPATSSASSAFEVATPSGYRVRAEFGVSVDDIVRLIGGLERLGC